MQNPNQPQKEDYVKKLYELEKAKERGEIAAYNDLVKVAKFIGWLFVAIVVFSFLLFLPVIGLLMMAGIGYWLYSKSK